MEEIKDIGLLAAKLQVVVGPVVEELLANNISVERTVEKGLSPLTLTNIAIGGAIKAIREALKDNLELNEEV